MEISSADFTKLTLQKVADILLDHDANGVICKCLVDGKMMKSPFQKRIRNDYFLAKNGGIL